MFGGGLTLQPMMASRLGRLRHFIGGYAKTATPLPGHEALIIRYCACHCCYYFVAIHDGELLPVDTGGVTVNAVIWPLLDAT